jgi:hypothetical protein
MFGRLRKKKGERRREKAGVESERDAAEGDPARPHDDRRARDLPDPVGDFNEMERMGPVINPGP